MEKPNITKGSWKNDNNSEIYTDENDDVIAIMPKYVEEYRKEGEANAQAISAVPELIDALMEAVTWDSHDSEGVPAVWLDDAIKALKKAGCEVE